MLPSSTLKLSASALALSKLYQHFRERDFPYGLQDSLCTLAPYCCSRVTPLRNGTNTRYGRVASPYPTGTYTPQETPSFARRDNVQAKAARATTDRASQHNGCGARSRFGRRLGIVYVFVGSGNNETAPGLLDFQWKHIFLETGR